MFDDFDDSESPELEFEPELSEQELEELWESIYSKISLAIINNHNFAIMFNMIPPGEVDPDEGSSAIIEKNQFEILLSNYLRYCEKKEKFERCSEVQKLLLKLKAQDIN